MRNEPRVLLLSLLVFLPFTAGCATIFNGTTDTIHVSAEYYLQEPLTPTDISLTVGGRGISAGGGLVYVIRSGNPLFIKAFCRKPGYTVTVQPTFVIPSLSAGWVILELFLPFGILGLIVDAASNALWNYPYRIDVTVVAKREHRSEP